MKYCYVGKLKVPYDRDTIFEIQFRRGWDGWESIEKSVGEPGRVLINYKRLMLVKKSRKRLLINGKQAAYKEE